MKPPTLVYLVNSGDNPSQEFFVSPLLENAGIAVESYSRDKLPDTPVDGAKVVFVRYIPSCWRHWVEANRGVFSGVALFMDDDVLDPDAATGTPWRYRWKLWRLAARHGKWLRDIGAELCVSSPYLQEKYADWPAKLVLPIDLATEPVTRVFYHGSASHRAEIAWLRPIIESVLEREERIRFELIADKRTQRQWRGMPRVTLVHPMKWPAYRSFSELQGRHIGLAPLLDLPFNRARSYTKFFDVTRSGAVGIYSDHKVFRGVVQHDRHGLVLENEPEVWVDGIIRLAGDGDLRARLLEAAREQVQFLSERARENNAGLL